jgi:hypothetical protein
LCVLPVSGLAITFERPASVALDPWGNRGPGREREVARPSMAAITPRAGAMLRCSK